MKSFDRDEYDQIALMVQQAVDIQASSGNWDYDPYMHGMLNGMIYVQHVMFGDDHSEPDFREAPKEWLHDVSKKRKHEAMLNEHTALKESYEHYCFLLNIIKGEDGEEFKKLYNDSGSADGSVSKYPWVSKRSTIPSHVKKNP